MLTGIAWALGTCLGDKELEAASTPRAGHTAATSRRKNAARCNHRGQSFHIEGEYAECKLMRSDIRT